MRRGPTRTRIAVAALAITALVLTVVVVARAVHPHDQVNLADVAAVAIAAATAIAAVVAWSRRRPAPVAQADAAVTTAVLAALVERQWQAEARHRSLDDPEPIPVRWQLSANQAVMSPSHLISSQEEFTFAGRGDDVAALARDFRALKRRRLVITGGPGMGKTTLAVQLLLQLLATRAADQAAADAAGHGEVVPVPMLLPVSGWDLQAHPGLQEWLTDRLTADYPALSAPELGPGAAAALVNGGRILPVLDGLDEMGKDDQGKVIAALNASLHSGDQIIVTSRTTEFAAAVAGAGRPLTGAAVITPARLTPETATDYLTSCLAGDPSPVWRRVLDALRSQAAPGLTELAQTPLGLWLIRAVYLNPGADPTPLAGPLASDAAALRAHLLDRLIPALIRARPPSSDPTDHFRPRHRLDPRTTRRHLTYLAHAFDPAATRDITWWHIARTTSHIQLVGGLVFGLLGGLLGGLAFGLVLGLVFDLLSGLVFGLVFGLAFGLEGWLGVERWGDETPGYASLRGRRRLLHTIRSKLVGRRLRVAVMGALGFGLMGLLGAGIVFGIVSGIVGGLLGRLVDALMNGLLEWAEQPTLTSASTPRSTWRADRTLTLFRMLVVGLVVGPVFGIVGGLAVGLLGVLDRMLVVGLMSGLVGGLVGGLVVGFVGGPLMGNHHAWLAFTIATAWLALKRRLPWRIMNFLDDAHRLGLLRAVGPVYQFRHAALHDHLAVTDIQPGAG
ncbi:NACHT domain-containing protein [Nonomuraea sp. NPDC003707]